MTHAISIDDDTYAMLKRQAKDNGRTIIGQVRYMMKDFVTPADIQTDNNPKNKIQQRINELTDELDGLDEDSDGYNEILAQLEELQRLKKMDLTY